VTKTSSSDGLDNLDRGVRKFVPERVEVILLDESVNRVAEDRGFLYALDGAYRSSVWDGLGITISTRVVPGGLASGSFCSSATVPMAINFEL
jgi:hypothetical protein